MTAVISPKDPSTPLCTPELHCSCVNTSPARTIMRRMRRVNLTDRNPYRMLVGVPEGNGSRRSVAVEALCYKPEGRALQTR
jgi:hypothetical protein